MRLLIRTSRWSIWARRLAVFALPILVLSVWLHRKGIIPSDTFTLFLSGVTILAIMALFTAMVAFARIWATGDQGWGHSFIGFVLGIITLSPVLIAVPNYLKYPALTDITTDIESVPKLSSAPFKQGVQEWQRAGYAEKVTLAYPSLGTRIYDLLPQQTWVEIEALADEQSWRITQKKNPLDQFTAGELSAVARSLFGYFDDVTIRVEPDFDGSRLDMRSASRYGNHDLGKNGRRIEKFLRQLDARIAAAQQRALAAGDDEDE